jgi:hypothetical protein
MKIQTEFRCGEIAEINEAAPCAAPFVDVFIRRPVKLRSLIFAILGISCGPGWNARGLEKSAHELSASAGERPRDHPFRDVRLRYGEIWRRSRDARRLYDVILLPWVLSSPCSFWMMIENGRLVGKNNGGRAKLLLADRGLVSHP